MTDLLTRLLKQTVTYWGNPAPDGWGGFTFDDPLAIVGRWEDRTELFINAATGREERSRAVVYLNQDVDVGGYLYLGTATDSADDNPKDVDGAFQIKAFEKSPDIKGTRFSRKAWL